MQSGFYAEEYHDTEKEFLLSFAEENAKDLAGLDYADECLNDLSANQLRSLWTAYALQNDIEPDTGAYDALMRELWSVIEKNGEVQKTQSAAAKAGVKEKWNGLLEELTSPFDKFDLFMGAYLS